MVTRLRRGTVKRIHVNQHMIRDDRKHGGAQPVISVVTSNGVLHGRRVTVVGPSEVIYSPDRPRKCGARVWIETRSPVEVTE